MNPSSNNVTNLNVNYGGYGNARQPGGGSNMYSNFK